MDEFIQIAANIALITMAACTVGFMLTMIIAMLRIMIDDFRRDRLMRQMKMTDLDMIRHVLNKSMDWTARWSIIPLENGKQAILLQHHNNEVPIVFDRNGRICG